MAFTSPTSDDLSKEYEHDRYVYRRALTGTQTLTHRPIIPPADSCKAIHDVHVHCKLAGPRSP